MVPTSWSWFIEDDHTTVVMDRKVCQWLCDNIGEYEVYWKHARHPNTDKLTCFYFRKEEDKALFELTWL